MCGICFPGNCVVMLDAQDSTAIRDFTTQSGARYSTTSALQSLQSLQYSAASVELQRGGNTTVKKVSWCDSSLCMVLYYVFADCKQRAAHLSAGTQ